MLFHTPEFIFSFLIVFGLYWISSHRIQNAILLMASLGFYGYWKWQCLILIFFTTFVDYYCCLKIHASQNPVLRKQYLLFSLGSNLAMLGFFKYADFFMENLGLALQLLGAGNHVGVLGIVLPIGISFYTFQSISYTVDVYKKTIVPETSFSRFALFITFFPQLIAGPIERAGNLLTQVQNKRRWSFLNLQEGVWLFFMGFFQKMVVADNLSTLVDWVFEQDLPHDGWLVLLAVYAFAFQILADFSGYTDMARGLAKCLGFELSINFKAPYFSSNPSEFWTRWHITLSSWLRDYLYIPLGGNRSGFSRQFINLGITMILGGLWHGAAWNFLLWGAFHGILLIGYHALKLHAELFEAAKRIPRWVSVVCYFHLTCVGWIFFRCHSWNKIVSIFKSIFLNFNPQNITPFEFPFFFIMGTYALWQWLQYRSATYGALLQQSALFKTFVYLFLFYTLIMIGNFNHHQFIYFQF